MTDSIPRADDDTGTAPVKDDLLAAIPKLRGFAASLCGRTAQADDLVQETLVKAWSNLGSFEPGTNMIGWLYRILRNEFYSDLRRRRREVTDEEGRMAARLASRPAQEGHILFMEFRTAMAALAPDQREALTLVGASGLSYEEAAGLCGCAVGTMKSRVNRARTKLAELLALAAGDGMESDRTWDAAIDEGQTGTPRPAAAE